MPLGKIVQWLKAEGDKVEESDVVMVVESDKADMDVEAYSSGEHDFNWNEQPLCNILMDC